MGWAKYFEDNYETTEERNYYQLLSNEYSSNKKESKPQNAKQTMPIRNASMSSPKSTFQGRAEIEIK